MEKTLPKRWALGWAVLLEAFAVTAGCSSSTNKPAEQPSKHESEKPRFAEEVETRAQPLRYRFKSIDGREISDVSDIGRPKIFLFLTSYDWASQTQATYVKQALDRYRKAKCAFFFLEKPEDVPLVDVYMKTVGTTCPAVVLSPDELAKTSLSMVRSVPTTIILDGASRPVWIARGVVDQDKIERRLRRYGSK